MSQNVGTTDRMIRIVAGLCLIAFAFNDGVPIQGWHWAGLIGVVPLLTGIFATCPAYSIVGFSSCEKNA